MSDIYAPIRAKRLSIDWSKVHICGDRREPVNLPERRQVPTLGVGIRRQQGGKRG